MNFIQRWKQRQAERERLKAEKFSRMIGAFMQNAPALVDSLYALIIATQKLRQDLQEQEVTNG